MNRRLYDGGRTYQAFAGIRRQLRAARRGRRCSSAWCSCSSSSISSGASKRGARVGDNPWEATTLEWTTTSPPPHENFRDAARRCIAARTTTACRARRADFLAADTSHDSVHDRAAGRYGRDQRHARASGCSSRPRSCCSARCSRRTRCCASRRPTGRRGRDVLSLCARRGQHGRAVCHDGAWPGARGPLRRARGAAAR